MLRPLQKGLQFEENILENILLNQFFFLFKPLPEPVMTHFPDAYICIARPQWVVSINMHNMRELLNSLTADKVLVLEIYSKFLLYFCYIFSFILVVFPLWFYMVYCSDIPGFLPHWNWDNRASVNSVTFNNVGKRDLYQIDNSITLHNTWNVIDLMQQTKSELSMVCFFKLVYLYL